MTIHRHHYVRYKQSPVYTTKKSRLTVEEPKGPATCGRLSSVSLQSLFAENPYNQMIRLLHGTKQSKCERSRDQYDGSLTLRSAIIHSSFLRQTAIYRSDRHRPKSQIKICNVRERFLDFLWKCARSGLEEPFGFDGHRARPYRPR